MFVFFAKKTIEYYWKNVSESNRRVCIYKISCSRFVYNEFHNFGFISGVKAYVYRLRNCNRNYIIYSTNGKVQILTKFGHILDEDQINPKICKEYNS